MVISYTNSEGVVIMKLPSRWRFELKDNTERMEDSSLTLVLPKDDTKDESLSIRNVKDYPDLPSGISALILRYIMKHISMKVDDPNSMLIDIDSLERKALSEVCSNFDNLADCL